MQKITIGFFTFLGILLAMPSLVLAQGNIVIEGENGAYYPEDEYIDCDPNYDPYCESQYYEPEEAPFGTVNNQILQVTEARMDVLYATIKKVSYVLAGVGAIALVVMAAFGKFQWKWFFMLILGLFLLASFQGLINFLN